MSRLLLVDNSVLQRIALRPTIAESVRRLVAEGGVLCSSDPIVLEAGYSARSATDHAALISQLTREWRRLPVSSEIGDVAIDLQRRLFAVGHGRSAGAVDLLHAATAIVHDAVVVHYDADYERLAEVDDRLHHRWVVSQGSVD